MFKKKKRYEQEETFTSFNPNYNNTGIGTVTAKECSGNNVDVLVYNINQIVQEGEELSAVSNFKFVDGYWRCIVLVRQLPQNMYNIHGVIEI